MASNFTILEPNNFGGKLAEGINQGLSSGLQTLANQKLERMQRKAAQHDLLSAFPDIPKEAAAYISTRPAKEQMQILEMLGNQRRQQEEQMVAEQSPGIQQFQQSPNQHPQIPTETNEMVQDEAYANDLEKALSTPHIVQQLSPEQIQEATTQLEQIKQKLAQNPVGVNPFPQQQTQPAQPLQQPVAESKGGIPLTSLATPKPPVEVVESKEQQMIDKHNAPYLDNLTKYISDAKRRAELAISALQLVESDELTHGPYGLLPEGILTSTNAANADYVSLIAQLANEKALELRGPVGEAKLEAANRTKAGLHLPKKAKIKILNREIEEAEKAQSLEIARQELMAENNGLEPKDFERKIVKRADEINESRPKNVVDKVPKLPEDAEEGEIFDLKNGQSWQVKNGKPVKIKG